jgi:trimethylamine monooxygenase
MQVHKQGAESITVSYRTKPTGLKWPDRICEMPILKKIDGKIVHFSDGSEKMFDSIIMCTGYQHNVNFMADKLRLIDRNRFYPSGLYKGIFFHSNPRLAYLGMQDQAFTLTMFDAQAWYARDVILGRIVLPDQQTQIKDIETWQKREEALCDRINFIEFQADYIDDLIKATNYPLDIYLQANIFKAALRNRLDNIATYREKSFASVITGTVAAEPLKTIFDSIDERFHTDNSPSQ